MKTLWYMGVKTRLIPSFIEEAILAAAPSPGATLLDAFSGTAAVGTALAGRLRVVANDVQGYAAQVARAYLVHEPSRKAAFLAALDPEGDLGAAYRENLAQLAPPLEDAIAVEDAFLLAHGLAPSTLDPACDSLGEPLVSEAARARARARVRAANVPALARAYRAFALSGTPRFEEGREAALSPPFEAARDLLGREAVLARRADPARAPYLLATAYYTNVYLGVRQAIATDSLRFAIDRIDPRDPFARPKRDHYLAALLHALSVTTSATSHFCQPRGLARDSEVQAVLRRRAPSIASRTVAFSREIAATVAGTDHRPENAVFQGDWRDLFRPEGRGAAAWASPAARADVVYVDPPYTSDNYSRFYHLLEVVTDYDYPLLDQKDGRVTKGRYPAIDRRHQSSFCKRSTVEGELEELLASCARAGAAAVVSYSLENGLLLRKFQDDGLGREAALERFQGLARRSYGRVELRTRRLAHSGQGDSNHVVTELLLVCREPLGVKGAAARGVTPALAGARRGPRRAAEASKGRNVAGVGRRKAPLRREVAG